MTSKKERISRITAIHDEYRVALVASMLLAERLQAEPIYLKARGLSMRFAQAFAANLDGTFCIRLFAEFESGLRDFWAKGLKMSTNPRAKDLLDGITARRAIPGDVADAVHQVREYRNGFVHEEHASVPPLTPAEVQQRLSAFFSRLPPRW